MSGRVVSVARHELEGLGATRCDDAAVTAEEDDDDDEAVVAVERDDCGALSSHARRVGGATPHRHDAPHPQSPPHGQCGLPDGQVDFDAVAVADPRGGGRLAAAVEVAAAVEAIVRPSVFLDGGTPHRHEAPHPQSPPHGQCGLPDGQADLEVAFFSPHRHDAPHPQSPPHGQCGLPDGQADLDAVAVADLREVIVRPAAPVEAIVRPSDFLDGGAPHRHEAPHAQSAPHGQCGLPDAQRPAAPVACSRRRCCCWRLCSCIWRRNRSSASSGAPPPSRSLQCTWPCPPPRLPSVLLIRKKKKLREPF
jgi:hypothetical protein